ncbi:MAG: ArsI/CadI family heavy metal resistance metalloenzyme, partial [Candidatus Nanopelagicales bacterium]
LALNVADLEASVEFYSRLFGATPHKVRPGYANFEVAEPPLKLVLLQTDERGTGVTGALNHLGVEVASTDQVREAIVRLAGEGLAVTEEMNTTCCHAVQDKGWVLDPAGTPWEVYTVTDDHPQEAATPSGCCTPTAVGGESLDIVSCC